MAAFPHINDDQDDEKLQDAIRDADYSPDAAAFLLLRAADFLETGQALPTRLAIRIAAAFRAAGQLKSADQRPAKLAKKLGLMPVTKPNLNSSTYVGEFVESLMEDDKLSQTKAVSVAAKKFKIAVSTTRNYLTTYQKAKELSRE